MEPKASTSGKPGTRLSHLRQLPALVLLAGCNVWRSEQGKLSSPSPMPAYLSLLVYPCPSDRPCMLAWMGGKRRLIELAQHRAATQRRHHHVAAPQAAHVQPSATIAAKSPLPSVSPHTTKRKAQEQEQKARQRMGVQCSRPKRVKAVQHSLDLLAVSMPMEFAAPQGNNSSESCGSMPEAPAVAPE